MVQMMKKGAADLIAIVIAIVVVGALAYAILNYFSNQTRTAAKTGIDSATSNLLAATSSANATL